MLSTTIDWLNLTFLDYYDENGELSNGARDFILRYASAGTVVPSPAHNGYTAATTDENGVSVNWNDDRPEMGHHAILSGSALRHLVERCGVSPAAILESAVKSSGRIARLDIAIDLVGGQEDIREIYKILQTTGNRGTAVTWREISQNDGGYTLYVGARTSEKYIRIYDKAKEQGIPDLLWSRFEIETKGKVARACAVSLTRGDNWSGVFYTIARQMLRPQNSLAYEQFFSKDVVPIGLPKIERKSDRERWIEEQVISAVAKHYIDNPQSEAVQRLRQTLDLIERQKLL